MAMPSLFTRRVCVRGIGRCPALAGHHVFPLSSMSRMLPGLWTWIPPPCTLLEGNPTSPTSPAPLLTLAFGKWLPVPPYMLPRTVGPRRSSSVPPCPLATGAGSVKLNLPPDTPVQQLHPPNQGGGTELSRTLQRGGKHCETHLIQPAHGASCSPRQSH